jgi:flavin reductase (DIM6/NTAB) family NADH-FMN oxidoreductase RutF
MILKPFMREEQLPLPVTFISTLSRGTPGKDGIRNIAPYACVMPVLRPLDLICLASAHKRDTLRNIRETGEFVVNLAGTDLADKVIPTARHTSPETDEFELAGLDEKPSITIRAPGIAGCYAWMECSLHKAYEEEDYVLIVGKVLRLEVADDVLTPEGTLDVHKAKPLMMVGGKKGMRYCTVVETGAFDSFGAMFPNGRDPLADRYSK